MAQLDDLLANASNALRHGFKFESQLATLATEGFNLRVCMVDFNFQAVGIAIGASQALFRLRQLIAQP
jgi:hypothetical protein